MKTNRFARLALLGLSAIQAVSIFAATPLIDVQMNGLNNQVKSASTLSVLSGGNLTLASGSTFTAPANAITWAAVNKSGSSLADLATRSASDLSSGTVSLARLYTSAAGYGITNGAALDSFAAAQSGTAQNLTTTASPTFAGVTANTLTAASATNLTLSGGATSGNVVVHTSGSTLAATFAGSNTTLAGTLTVSGTSVSSIVGGFAAGRISVGGGGASTDRQLEATGIHPGTAPSLFGLVVNPTFPATTTTAAYGAYYAPSTNAAAFTLANGYCFYVDTFGKGVGSTITTAYGLFINDQTNGVTNYAIKTGAGLVKIGDTTASSSTTTGAFVVGSNVGISGDIGGPSYFGGTIIGKADASTVVGLNLQGRNNSGTDETALLFTKFDGTTNHGYILGVSGRLELYGGSTKAIVLNGADPTVAGNLTVSGTTSAIGASISSSTNLNLAASTTGISSLRIPHGTAPTSPVNGDIWTTTSGAFARINGATVSLASTGGTGDVVGPASAVDSRIAAFDGTTGKLIKDGGKTIAELALSGAVTGSGLTMTTARLLGRTTASTGAVEEITVGTGLSLSAGALTATSTGDVVGPGSATDNAIVRYDGTTGKLVQNSAASVADDGQLSLTINSSSTSPTGFAVTNSNSAGRASLSMTNDSGFGGTFGTYGSAYTASTYQNQFSVAGDKGVYFFSDGGVAGSGTDSIHFIAGGYNNVDSLEVKAGNPGGIRMRSLGSGTVTSDASGNLTVSSDARLKQVREDFTRGLADIVKITPKYYFWRRESGLDPETKYAGLIAQDVQAAIPEAVSTDPRGYLALSDRPIIAALVNADKDIDARIATLEAWLACLAGVIAGLAFIVVALATSRSCKNKA